MHGLYILIVHSFSSPHPLSLRGIEQLGHSAKFPLLHLHVNDAEMYFQVNYHYPSFFLLRFLYPSLTFFLSSLANLQSVHMCLAWIFVTCSTPPHFTSPPLILSLSQVLYIYTYTVTP